MEAPGHRGGVKWFTANIAERRGLSVSYNGCSEERKVDLKEKVVINKRYKKWIDWKKFGLKMGDYDTVLQLFGDVL